MVPQDRPSRAARPVGAFGGPGCYPRPPGGHPRGRPNQRLAFKIMKPFAHHADICRAIDPDTDAKGTGWPGSNTIKSLMQLKLIKKVSRGIYKRTKLAA
jgi:hypothetical protein